MLELGNRFGLLGHKLSLNARMYRKIPVLLIPPFVILEKFQTTPAVQLIEPDTDTPVNSSGDSKSPQIKPRQI